MVVWIIGLAGAGKTTVGRELYALLKDRERATVFLDGDHVRQIMGDDLGHTVEQRRENGWRICRLCRYLDSQDIDVVCCILSLFHDQQAWNRRNMSRYFEVYLDVPMDVLQRRDQKGLYTGALKGKIEDVVGIDIEFEPPQAPDLALRNDDAAEPPDLAHRILMTLDAEHDGD